MGPDMTRHGLEPLATRCAAMLHVAKTDVTLDSKTKVHCPRFGLNASLPGPTLASLGAMLASKMLDLAGD